RKTSSHGLIRARLTKRSQRMPDSLAVPPPCGALNRSLTEFEAGSLLFGGLGGPARPSGRRRTAVRAVCLAFAALGALGRLGVRVGRRLALRLARPLLVELHAPLAVV